MEYAADEGGADDGALFQEARLHGDLHAPRSYPELGARVREQDLRRFRKSDAFRRVLNANTF